MKYLYIYSKGNEVLHNKIVTNKTMKRESEGSSTCEIRILSNDEVYLRSMGHCVQGLYLSTTLLK